MSMDIGKKPINFTKNINSVVNRLSVIHNYGQNGLLELLFELFEINFTEQQFSVISEYLNKDDLKYFKQVFDDFYTNSPVLFKYSESDSHHKDPRQTISSSYQDENYLFSFRAILSKNLSSTSDIDEIYCLSTTPISKSTEKINNTKIPIPTKLPSSESLINPKSSTKITHTTQIPINTMSSSILPTNVDSSKIINTIAQQPSLVLFETSKPKISKTKPSPQIKTTEASSQIKTTEPSPQIKTTEPSPQIKTTEPSPQIKSVDVINDIYDTLKINNPHLIFPKNADEMFNLKNTPLENTPNYENIYVMIDIIRSYNKKDLTFSEKFQQLFPNLIERFDNNIITADDIEHLKRFPDDFKKLQIAVSQVKESENIFLQTRLNVENHKSDTYFILDVDIFDKQKGEVVCSRSIELDNRFMCEYFVNLIVVTYIKIIRDVLLGTTNKSIIYSQEPKKVRQEMYKSDEKNIRPEKYNLDKKPDNDDKKTI
jgi:hypothetical protein